MALKMRFVGRHVLDADPVLVRSRLNNAVNQQKRVAMRQQREKLLDIEALKHTLGRFVHSTPRPFGASGPPAYSGLLSPPNFPAASCFSAATSRKNSRIGFAGAPPHRSPAGMSVITPAAAATWAP